MSPLTDDEVLQLRERVRELEADLETERRARQEAETRAPSPDTTQDATTSTDTARAGHGRSVVGFVALMLACVLAPLSVLSVWASTYVSDTDQYVATVAPLADDPEVQRAVAAEVTTAVLAAVDVEGVTTDLLDALASQDQVPPRVATALPALVGPITSGVEGFAQTQVERVLASDEFATLWAEVNRVAHTQVVRLLEGDPDGAVTAQDDTVTLNLAPIIERVKQELLDRGFTLADNIPVVDRSFVLVESDQVTQAQTGYRALLALGAWLPVVALALFAIGVAAARDRRRALLRGALGVVAAMLLLGVVLALLRTWYVETTPAGILTAEGAGNVFDALAAPLRTGLRATAVLGLVVALAAFVSGPSAAASALRVRAARGVASLQGSADAAGWRTGPVGPWTYRHRQGLRLAVLLAAGLVVVFWTRPTGWVVLGTAVAALLAVGIVSFLARPPVPEAAGAGLPPGAPLEPDDMPRQRAG